ncbi:hypothetical protein IPM65_03880 [Candidatus Roizmanbacteria bacterium]|nr:MAG: hypothetical protein IPM65_03880 [Candidatus Roizmanbacteria bacterium]
MTEGVPGGNDMPTQLDDILKRLADASEVETNVSDTDDIFHINAELFPHMAEAAERISKELQILDAQARIVEATAVASSVLWSNANHDQDVRLLDSGIEQYRRAVDPELYQKSFQELADALKQARKSYLQTFWTETSEGLIVPSLEAADVGFMKDFIAGTLDDPGRFHNTMTESVLPLFASMALKQTPQIGETYLALRRAVEANAVGWVIDPFTVKGHSPTEVKQLIGWDNTSAKLLSAVDPFDGYKDKTLRSYPYVSFMPRLVGGRMGGRAITELGSRKRL